MSLETYDVFTSPRIVSLDAGETYVRLAPGILVRYGWDKCSRGIIIARQDDHITVLWSIAPGLRTMEEELAQQIQDEIDVDIIKDLLATGIER